MAPGAGACWRTVPSPTISIWSPEEAAFSITWRTESPVNEGTAMGLALEMVTVELLPAPAAAADAPAPAFEGREAAGAAGFAAAETGADLLGVAVVAAGWSSGAEGDWVDAAAAAGFCGSSWGR